MTSRDRFLARLWGTVEEPRAVTLITVFAYLIAAVLGYSLLLVPPVGHDQGVWLRLACALFLIGGGTVGVPGAWSGARWLEKGAAFSAGAGMVITLTEVMSVHQERQLATPWITVLSLVLAGLFWVARYARIRDDAYAPGRGPLLPEQILAVQEALEENPSGEGVT